jgi:multimeric flavodoxin WrbA
VSQRSFLFVLGSTRADGNTETLARAAAEHLPEGATATWVTLADLDLPPFVDLRHEGDGSYPAPTGDAAALLDATLAATDLVIVSPLYWYSVSASVKLYLDHWSAWMRVPGVDFRARMAGRRMWAISAVSSEDRRLADPLIGTLTNTAVFMKMDFAGALIGYANRPGDIVNDTETLAAAESFFLS